MGSAPLGDPYSDTWDSSVPPDSSGGVAYNREIHETVYATYPLNVPLEVSDKDTTLSSRKGVSLHSSVATATLFYFTDSQTAPHEEIILPLSNSPVEDVPVGHYYEVSQDFYNEKGSQFQTAQVFARHDSYGATLYPNTRWGYPTDPTQRPRLDIA